MHNKGNFMKWNPCSEAKSRRSASKMLHINGTRSSFLSSHQLPNSLYLEPDEFSQQRHDLLLNIRFNIIIQSAPNVIHDPSRTILISGVQCTNYETVQYAISSTCYFGQFSSINAIKIVGYYTFRNPNIYVNPTCGN
jgi:hypothetical protein